ncbi:hypothetical protein BGZ60DRAFT_405395 [Tricladium varicosporioides]|nr:hypothetical protein BGZ60DRAFT_405395 [Hymenoscyphus varicosporioides]
MCNYHLLHPLCGHTTLLAGSNCYAIFAQLQRINDPSECSAHHLPFQLPDQCLPGRWNTRRRYVNDYCSWECRNNGVLVGEGGRCGEVGARYGPGSERLGVGWRC